jgi:hypothetical protein
LNGDEAASSAVNVQSRITSPSTARVAKMALPKTFRLALWPNVNVQFSKRRPVPPRE